MQSVIKNMMLSRHIVLLFCLTTMSYAMVVTEAKADKIYKIVDENGQVTYSSTPPDDANTDIDTSTIDVTPPPSGERVEAAQQRHERNINAAEQMDENRKTRNEMISEENRLKRERQQAMQQSQTEESSKEEEHYGYPHIRRPYPYDPVRPRPPIAVPLPQR